ncbi:MAG: Fur family transcriptional regulator [Actinomycetota bacterium]
MHVDADRLLDSLRDSGLRITVARRAVCQVLAESHDEHLTAIDLHHQVEVLTGAKVDPSTIYRTIDVLERGGHLCHVHFGHGPGVVHLVDGRRHHHLVCETCGRTVDLGFGELVALSKVLDTHGFSMGSVHFAIVAQCATHPEAAALPRA